MKFSVSVLQGKKPFLSRLMDVGLPLKRTLAFDSMTKTSALLQHEDICKFPSITFYEGKLKTGVDQPRSVLRINDRVVPFAFGHIEGTTVSQVVNTNKGNEKSKTNAEERKMVVRVWTVGIGAKRWFR